MIDRLISAGDLAYRTGWHLMTVYRKAKRGEIPGLVKLGKSVRFKESAVQKWLQCERTQNDGSIPNRDTS
jgi:excisionase family DNA binding protein